ncbi:response regulator [Geminocystis sp. GBBB08]|uniref:response regulator n=1 Tax=Geminocystis sp. GBBB08 TaxID=2604140 RepID=UPI0027E35FE8|nr:response regulator [Geminocystis sp. GBBB08]MBL1208929.1 response regulator [Geminocystis sp. GBBB08]
MTDNLRESIQDSRYHLLVVEDSDTDFAVFSRFLQKLSFHNPVYRCYDGDDALDYLYHRGKYQNFSIFSRPSLILLDLNLPGTDGKEVLTEIKKNDFLKTIPVIIFTTSSNPDDIQTCYQKGANTYIIKPMDLNKMKIMIQSLLEYWFYVSILPSH